MLEYYVLYNILCTEATTNDPGAKGKTIMTPSVLLQRRRDFYNALLEKAKDHHDVRQLIFFNNFCICSIKTQLIAVKVSCCKCSRLLQFLAIWG